MTRRLDLLVPVYDEGEEVLRPLLDSVALQRNVDFDEIGVIVCCDGGDTVVTEETMSRYPFHIEFHMCEHGGVSATRNACLDHSDAEYVTWVDADDMYCDACGLTIVFREMDARPNPQELAVAGLTAEQVGTGFDVLVSCFREETKDRDGNVTYVNHDNDTTFVHGKVMRRQYLLDNDIRWNPGLTIHEDSFFNILARECAHPLRAKYCPMPFFLWCWRDASVCRHDPKYILKTFGNMIDSNDAVVDEFVRRMMPEKAAQYVAFMILDSYYTLNKPEWVETNNAEYRDRVERRFAAYYRKHRGKWESLSPQERAVISSGVRQRSVGEGMLMEAVTLDDWLARTSEL